MPGCSNESKWDFNNPAGYHALSQLKDTEIKYYLIAGNNPEELRKQMDHLGVLDLYGKRRDAYTKWHLTWSWPTDANQNPEFDKTTSKIKFTINLPKWLPESGVSNELHEKWIGFYRAMLDHEYNHVKLALAQASKVSEAVRKRFQQNPNLEIDQAHQAAKAVVRQMYQADSEYDQKTQSGKLEGVVFP
ncbi:MAG: DUF922 domain-containing protein [Bdellovibrionota bacterium]